MIKKYLYKVSILNSLILVGSIISGLYFIFSSLKAFSCNCKMGLSLFCERWPSDKIGIIAVKKGFMVYIIA